MKRNKTLHEKIMKSKDLDEIFDLVCAANYFAGNFDWIKTLLRSSQ